MTADTAEWYVQKGARVQGPFSATEVGRFLVLGRVRRSDRVSRDGELWEPVTQVPELVPEALLDLDSPGGWSRFARERAAGDERSDAAGERRPGAGAGDAAHPHRAAAGRGEGTATEPGPANRALDAGPESDSDTRLERRERVDALREIGDEWRRADVSRPAPARVPVRGNLLPWSLLCLTLAALGVVLWLDRAALPPG